jgi:tRNA(Ile)-lysidine synthase
LPFEYSLQDRKIVITEIVKSSIIPRDNQDIIFINADQLLDGLILRGVRPGDIFQPSGMKGKSQKLKDYFINQKVHLFDKEKLVVLTHKNDIIAIPGYRKSEKVAITQDTGKIWKIELKNLSNIDSIPG